MNKIKCPPIAETTLPQILKWRSVNEASHVALRQKDLGIWKPVTWHDYMAQASEIACALISLGIAANDRVGILSENRKEWVIAQMGIGLARGICVGIYPTSPSTEIQYVTQHCLAKIIICEDQEQVDKLLLIKNSLPHLKKVIVLDMKGMKNYDYPWIINFSQFLALGKDFINTDPDIIDRNLNTLSLKDTALIVYTSGSTGKPKGAILTWGNLSFTAWSAISGNGFSASDSCVSYLPLCHVAEQLVSVITGIGAGIEVNFGESIRTIQMDLQEIAPSVFLGVPRIWEKMHSVILVKAEEAGGIRLWMFRSALSICEPFAEKRKLSWSLREHCLFIICYWLVFRSLQNHLGLRRARILLSGAAPISSDLLKFFRTIGIPVREAFGMTETTALGFMQDSTKIITGTVGFPLPGVEAKIASDGELMMRGEMIFEGYHNDPDTTSQTLKDGWLHTGDLAEELEGQFRIIGRKKEIIITAGGKNLSPSELENNLKVSPYIKEAIVCGDGKKFLSALIQIDFDNTSKWAERKSLAFTNYKSLASNKDVYKLIDAEIITANEKVSNVAGIKKFVILNKELDHDDDEMTATQKIRRNNILKKYKAQISSIYDLE